MYLLEEFEKLITGLDYGKTRKMQLEFVLRLIKKLMERNIKDEKFAVMFGDLLKSAVDYSESREQNLRYYKKQKSGITNYAMKIHGLVYKGYYTATYMALGLIFGTALGTVFMTSLDTAYYALGVGPGIAIGVALGSARENKARKEGLVY
jgi:hypothetical protein